MRLALATVLLLSFTSSIANADAHATAKKNLDHAKMLLGEAQKQTGSDAAVNYKKCLKFVDEAVKADASIEAEAADTRATCEAGGAKSEAAAGTASADDNDIGKQIKASLAGALALSGKKNMEATDLVAGQKSAKDCLEGLRRLHSTIDGRRKPLYDFDKSKLTLPDGSVSLNEVKKRCTGIQTDLASRKVNGCGTKELLVTQQLIGTKPDRWGPLAFSVTETYDPAACKDMPKVEKIGGTSKSYAGQFRGNCKGGVVIIDSNEWSGLSAASDGSPFHSMGGLCWMKGMLNFKMP